MVTTTRQPETRRPRIATRYVLLAALALIALLWAWEWLGRSGGGPAAGSTAPPVAGTTLDGRPFSLAELRGQTAVLLNFYSST